MKYQLRKGDTAFAIGQTNFSESKGSLIDTNGCIALSVISGYAIATINFKKNILRKGDFILLFYDSSFSIDKISASFLVQYFSLSYPLLEEVIYKPLSTLFWEALYSTPILHPSHDFEHLLSGWWQLMKWTITNESPMQKELVANSVRNLYIVIDSALNQSGMSVFHNKCSHSRMLINRFFKLLSIHCHETRDVKFYAEQLSITPTYLYKIVRKYMSQSPKELIDKQAISEIKSLLINSDMPIKSIASTLHFEDVSYLCRYFRRLTGIPPLEYRENNKE